MSLTRILCQCCGNPLAWCVCSTGTLTGSDGISHPIRCSHMSNPNKPTNEGMHMDDESKGSGVDIGLRDKLADHIRRLEMTGGEFDARKRVADAILADPQKHVDVLVAAGVLKEDKYAVCVGSAYTVVQPEPPHVHDWRWNIAREGWVICAGNCTAEFCAVAFPGKYKFVDMPKYDGEVPDA